MSAIEWTDQTWNPIAGCRRVSPGCDNCYAIKEARRKDGRKGGGFDKYAGTTGYLNGRLDWTGVVNFDPKGLDKPRLRKTPTIWFVNSMSDLFDHGVTDDQIRQVFEVMNATPHHTYQILTKRPHRAAKLAGSLNWTPNIWMGTSIEQDKFVNRARELAKIPAALRFISAEPLLGPLPSLDLTGIGWVIAGGESGREKHRIRRMMPDWPRDLRDRCAAANVPFFFKQWGNWDEHGVWHQSKKDAGHLLDGKEHFEMPPQVRLAMSKSAPARSLTAPQGSTVQQATYPAAMSREAFKAAILKHLAARGPMSGSDLRQANGAVSGPNANTHSWALVDLQREGGIRKRLDGRYGLIVRVKAVQQ